MGGECNYLHETSTDENTGDVSLKVIDSEIWIDGRGEEWDEDSIAALLDKAEV